MTYRQVPHPESCARVGSRELGGHCLVCGFDVAPFAGIGIEATRVICRGPDCVREFSQSTQGFRLHWASLAAKHLSPFGDHGCRHWVEAIKSR